MGSHVPDVYLINQAERLRYDLWINLDMSGRKRQAVWQEPVRTVSPEGGGRARAAGVTL